MSDDADLEELRKRKLMELQQAQMMEQQQMEMMERERAEIESQRQSFLRSVLTPEARERLSTVRMAHPQVADAVEEQLVMLVRSGRLTDQVDDQTMKVILSKVAPKKKETKITFR